MTAHDPDVAKIFSRGWRGWAAVLMKSAQSAPSAAQVLVEALHLSSRRRDRHVHHEKIHLAPYVPSRHRRRARTAGAGGDGARNDTGAEAKSQADLHGNADGFCRRHEIWSRKEHVVARSGGPGFRSHANQLEATGSLPGLSNDCEPHGLPYGRGI